jgi:hypothetical protein
MRPATRRRALDEPMPEPPPPILKSWTRLYAAVLLNLALLVAVFYAFTKVFS